MTYMIRPRLLALAGRCALASALAAVPMGSAFAAVETDPVEQLRRLASEVEAQRALLKQQADWLAAQQAQIDELKLGLELANIRGAGLAYRPTDMQVPDQPVGEAPPESEPLERAQVQAIPHEQGVLTPTGQLVFDPSIEYTRSSANRLVFRGIELIPGIQIGLIEATDADRDTLVGTASLRYGITDRLEAEVRLPYLYRNDRIEVVQQRDEGIVRQIALREDGVGDAEFSLRYQFNRPVGQKPIFVGTLRVKSDTGKGPFEIGYDEFGVATGLATGSGFWAVQPGLNFLMPSDPAVIYGGAAYLYHIPRDVNEMVGDVLIGRVDPGDAVSANIGFGFALNPRFSFSLGYRHNYIFPTKTEIGDTHQKSNYIHVGSLNFGMSYRLTQRDVLNLGFEIGVTEDAPDVSITLRMPFGGK